MFKINLKTFLSTPEEWHALVIGFFESLCPWHSRYCLTGESLAKLRGESFEAFAATTTANAERFFELPRE